MNITSPTTVGVENTQPPVSYFQRSSASDRVFWAVVLLFAASASCAAAAFGLWRGSRCGHIVAITLITINFLSDLIKYYSGNRAKGDCRSSYCACDSPLSYPQLPA